MKRKIYVETSVISYLTARPSKTIIGAAHQQITLAWVNWGQSRTKQPPAEAGGFGLRTGSPDTHRLNDAS